MERSSLTHFFCGNEISLSDILIASFTATLMKKEPLLVPLILDAYEGLKPYI
jgi:hypothetical protein